jgi:hypothetical protein
MNLFKFSSSRPHSSQDGRHALDIAVKENRTLIEARRIFSMTCR